MTSPAGFRPSRRVYDLAGKVVLITGGNGGIGAATAQALLDRGASVAVVDIDASTPGRATELHRTKALGCVADVRDRASLDAPVVETVQRFDRLSGLPVSDVDSCAASSTRRCNTRHFR